MNGFLALLSGTIAGAIVSGSLPGGPGFEMDEVPFQESNYGGTRLPKVGSADYKPRSEIAGSSSGYSRQSRHSPEEPSLEPRPRVAGYLIDYKQGVRPTSITGAPLVSDELGEVEFFFEGRLDDYIVVNAREELEYEDALENLEILAREAYVEAVLPNTVFYAAEPEVHLTGTAGEQTQLISWGLDRIDQRTKALDRKYSYRSAGEGVRVYIVDSGVDPHPEFGNRLQGGWNSLANSRNTDDCNGHGTHVAGIVAGKTFGVAKGAIIVPVRVFPCGDGGTTSAVVSRGLQWILDNHPSGEPGVVNLSLGGIVRSDYEDPIETKLQELIDAGIVAVVSSGNAGAEVCGDRWQVSPARLPDAITVGASGKSDRYTSWSNWGSCLDIWAPGLDITSAKHNSRGSISMSGTSMSAPFVAGAAARLLEENPSMTPGEIALQITGNATNKRVGIPALGDPNRLLFVEPAREFSAAPEPRLANDGGDPIGVVGEWVGIDLVGAWDDDPTFSYQWFRQRGAKVTPIVGEVLDSYILSAADVGKKVFARVTGEQDGFLRKTLQTNSTRVVNKLFVDLPTPTVSISAPVVGDVLVARPGRWPAKTTLKYQWFRDGVRIPKATNRVYRVVDADQGARLAVRVTATKVNYRPQSVWSKDTSAVFGLILERRAWRLHDLTPEYSQELRVREGEVNVVGTEVFYQWAHVDPDSRDGIAIDGATSPTYVLQAADVGRRLQLNIYAVADGYGLFHKILRTEVVRGMSFSSTPVPRVSGRAVVGETLSVDPQAWDDGTALSYQWFRQAGKKVTRIEGEDNDTYLLDSADAGKTVFVRVTGQQDGYVSATRQSKPTAAVKDVYSDGPSPTINNTTPVAGDRLVARLGTWPPGWRFSYQWFRDGVRIPKATKDGLTVGSGDTGSYFEVRVRAEKFGFVTQTLWSNSTERVIADFSDVDICIDGGPFRPGGEIAVGCIFSWAPTPEYFSYQWLRNGKAISGATEELYEPTAEDVGKRISALVTGHFGSLSHSVKSPPKLIYADDDSPVIQSVTPNISSPNRGETILIAIDVSDASQITRLDVHGICSGTFARDATEILIETLDAEMGLERWTVPCFVSPLLPGGSFAINVSAYDIAENWVESVYRNLITIP